MYFKHHYILSIIKLCYIVYHCVYFYTHIIDDDYWRFNSNITMCRNVNYGYDEDTPLNKGSGLFSISSSSSGLFGDSDEWEQQFRTVRPVVYCDYTSLFQSVSVYI